MYLKRSRFLVQVESPPWWEEFWPWRDMRVIVLEYCKSLRFSFDCIKKRLQLRVMALVICCPGPVSQTFEDPEG
jgi:hypothetical protein